MYFGCDGHSVLFPGKGRSMPQNKDNQPQTEYDPQLTAQASETVPDLPHGKNDRTWILEKMPVKKATANWPIYWYVNIYV